MDTTYFVVTFYSTNHALKCENLLKKENHKIKLIPVPRKISSNCGLAARIPPESLKPFLKLCLEKIIEMEQLFRVKEEGNMVEYVVLKN